MRKARLSTGFELPLDGDVLPVLEALYRELTLKKELRVGFEDTTREIRALVEQMSEQDRKAYLAESLFLNFVTYENEMLDAYMRRLAAAESGATKKKARKPASGTP